MACYFCIHLVSCEIILGFFFCFFFVPSLQAPLSSAGGKKSIFARQIAAQKLKECKTTLHSLSEAAPTPETTMDTDQCDAAGGVNH